MKNENKTIRNLILTIIVIITTIALSRYGKNILSNKAYANSITSNDKISLFSANTQTDSKQEEVIPKDNVTTNNTTAENKVNNESKNKKKEIPNTDELEPINDILTEKAYVMKVASGDTIIVKINDEEYTVRLIGIDAPEFSRDKNSIGRKSTKYTTDELIYQTVYLQKDKVDKDEDGNLLRYVWTKKIDSIDYDTAHDYLFNFKIVRKGYATSINDNQNTKLQEYIQIAEDKAQNEERGIWK